MRVLENNNNNNDNSNNNDNTSLSDDNDDDNNDDFLRQNLVELINIMKNDRENGSLNYCYDIRETVVAHLPLIEVDDLREVEMIEYPEITEFLKSLDQTSTGDILLYLVLISYFSVKYMDHYLPKVKCRSLRAIVKLCYTPKMVFNLVYREPELDVLTDIFNNLKLSSRRNLHCYDCGTTARWVFYNCIHANRGRFYLTSTEIHNIRSDYYQDSPDRFDCLRRLMYTFRNTNKPGIIIIGVRFGEDMFGHVLVAEVLFPNNKPIVRLYQSALNSYLLIDYLTNMRYLENESLGINLDVFEKDMMSILTPKFWTKKEDSLFAKWYAFWPQDKIKDTETIRIDHALLVY